MIFTILLKPSRDVNVVSKQLRRRCVNASGNKTCNHTFYSFEFHTRGERGFGTIKNKSRNKTRQKQKLDKQK